MRGNFFLGFSPFYLCPGARAKMAEIFQARAAIKTRVNVHKRESLSAQKIKRVSFVLLVLGSAVLRACNRSFFAIEKKRDTQREMVFQSRRHSLGKREITQIFEKNVHFLI
jgi:lipopolysaccharide/colanic/teichoic acid biosynthesis glycosyltransferase